MRVLKLSKLKIVMWSIYYYYSLQKVKSANSEFTPVQILIFVYSNRKLGSTDLCIHVAHHVVNLIR